jgi:hypothetical protein
VFEICWCLFYRSEKIKPLQNENNRLKTPPFIKSCKNKLENKIMLQEQVIQEILETPPKN